MIYPYRCYTCNLDFDFVKSIEEHNTPEHCQKCSRLLTRIYITNRPIVDKTEKQFYPSFGEVVTSKRHRKYLMEKNNAVELGSESIDKLAKRNKDLKRASAHKKYDEAVKDAIQRIKSGQRISQDSD